MRNVFVAGCALVMACALAASENSHALAVVDTNISDPVVHDATNSGPIQAASTIARGPASATAYANLDTGVLRAIAVGSGDSSQRLGTYASTASAYAVDYVTFAAGSSGIAYLDWEFRGSLSAASFNTVSTAYMSASATDASAVSVGDHTYLTTSKGLCAPLDSNCVQGTSIDRIGSLTINITPGRFLISSMLQVVAENGDSGDFSHTGLLYLRLPKGVTYTSASGTFLSDAAPILISAVPEPSSFLLSGFGLAFLALWARRSRSETRPKDGLR